MVAGDALDVGAGDTQVAQLAVVESGQLTDGLLVSGPLLQRSADAYWKSPFVYRVRDRMVGAG